MSTFPIEPKRSDDAVANVAPVGDLDTASEDNHKNPIPLKMKILSVIVVSMIGFGGHWSSGVTGALKSTLKKVCQTQCCPRLVICL